ncbi:MAG: hypothetical protein LBT91_03870 [Bifidobacteriaceae bacterium]|jgi:hypothetical protein|nr:hypothetical protein [Bifidobacteriaceae bacterium]
MKNKIKINKTINYLLAAFLGFGLVLGGVNVSAYAHDNIITDNAWYLLARNNGVEYWGSDTFNYPENVSNRKVKITLSYPGNTGDSFTVFPVELTGSGSWDNYFDCNGNEVYLKRNACFMQIGPTETKTLTVKLADSSWWKDRVGVYLKIYAPHKNYHYNTVNYTLEKV